MVNDFPVTTRFVQFPGGAIAISPDGMTVHRMVGDQIVRLYSEYEYAALPDYSTDSRMEPQENL